MTDALELGFTPTVYSLFYPETEEIINRLSKDYPHDLYKEAWTKKQDPLHDEFLKTWQDWSTNHLPNVRWGVEFPHSYPCNGSSEAIRESLAQFAADKGARGYVPRIHVFEGEYEGYKAIAEGYHIEVVEHKRNHWRSEEFVFSPGDCFYLSHPSSLDGNIWEDADDFIRSMAQTFPDVKIRLDLCYLGTTTRDFVLKNASMFNVDMIFFSLSKVFGVYYHRIGGVFSKRALPGLYGNKWFKNLFSLRLGTVLMQEFAPRDLPDKYAPLQAEAVGVIRKHAPNNKQLKASDVVLLASTNDWIYIEEYPRGAQYGPMHKEWEAPLIRGSRIRYCLTPYMGRKLGR